MSLRAGANHPTHLPFIKRPPKPLLLGYQGGDTDDETTRRRGALDIATHFIRVAFRRVVPVQRQRVNTLPRAGACSGDGLNTLAGVHRITPSSEMPWREGGASRADTSLCQETSSVPSRAEVRGSRGPLRGPRSRKGNQSTHNNAC